METRRAILRIKSEFATKQKVLDESFQQRAAQFVRQTKARIAAMEAERLARQGGLR